MIINGEFVKGNYYHDHSLRGFRNTPRYHNEFRIDVIYGGHRYRSRHKTVAEAEKALLLLKKTAH